MALVPNAPTVATQSSTMLTLYVGIIGNAADMLVKVLQSPSVADANIPWVQPALLVLMIIAAVCRLTAQKSIATATEQQLAKEKAVSKTLEQVATSEGPPITKADVEQIKREAAWKANPQPLKE